jgi:hypothetical protein
MNHLQGTKTMYESIVGHPDSRPAFAAAAPVINHKDADTR